MGFYYLLNSKFTETKKKSKKSEIQNIKEKRESTQITEIGNKFLNSRNLQLVLDFSLGIHLFLSPIRHLLHPFHLS